MTDTLFDDAQITDPDRTTLFDAPDFAELMKRSQTVESKRIETKIKSVLKAGVIGTVKAEDYPDAATLLKHGPAVARATGDLADSNEMVRKVVDMLTAPDNPVLLFAVVAIPMIMQLYRNHEPDIAQIRGTRKEIRAQRRQARREGRAPERKGLTVKLPFGRKFTLGFNIRLPFGRIMKGYVASQTKHPQALVNEVFADESLLKELKKYSINLRTAAREDL